MHNHTPLGVVEPPVLDRGNPCRSPAFARVARPHVRQPSSAPPRSVPAVMDPVLRLHTSVHAPRIPSNGAWKPPLSLESPRLDFTSSIHHRGGSGTMTPSKGRLVLPLAWMDHAPPSRPSSLHNCANGTLGCDPVRPGRSGQGQAATPGRHRVVGRGRVFLSPAHVPTAARVGARTAAAPGREGAGLAPGRIRTDGLKEPRAKEAERTRLKVEKSTVDKKGARDELG